MTASGAENQAARAALFLCEERPMPSSVISSFTYEPERQRLVVTFVTGRIYEYADVPPEVARNFRASFSKGVFFNEHIRDGFRNREITHAGERDRSKA
jgi:KTSC domain-containing protein